MGHDEPCSAGDQQRHARGGGVAHLLLPSGVVATEYGGEEAAVGMGDIVDVGEG